MLSRANTYTQLFGHATNCQRKEAGRQYDEPAIRGQAEPNCDQRHEAFGIIWRLKTTVDSSSVFIAELAAGPNNAKAPAEHQKTVVDALPGKIEKDMERKEKRTEGEKKTKDEKPEEKRTEDGSNPASGEVTLPTKKKKASRGRALGHRGRIEERMSRLQATTSLAGL
ncbi:hypothetical protein W97_06194 [Coniosporium apollinis CBS 100218]|uniref:Uncharacterized protein n=1 Tax=Coniosporium apollinis (strain CBS 100218) TaxID=1168221 RepID=R7YYV1_CONA1|nr:uncharacterized protein W97_06194 [Coniosporium apollinis CBS 100218]EON67077.1 hypothetical protein W97_06194 [Coniosporium apollinis CBS 100218]